MVTRTRNPDTGVEQDFDNYAAAVYLAKLLAGELGAGTASGMIRALPVRRASVISKTTAVTIGAGGTNDTVLAKVIVLATLTGTCVITGLADSDGTAQSITIPAGAASVGSWDMGDVPNVAGPLTVTCSNASDDNLVVIVWYALPAS